jgi:hypothetical protein
VRRWPENVVKVKLGQHLAQVERVSRTQNLWRPSRDFLRLESTLTRQIELAGKSGSRYRYTPLEEERFLPPAGANYVIAQLTPEGATLVYAGETDNLANQTWRSALETARKTFSDAKILTRLNVTRAVRKAEQEDLIQQHQPPMNRSAAS